MRSDEIKPGFVAMTLAQYDRMEKIIEGRLKLTEAQTIEILDDVFAGDVPINGVGGRFGATAPRAIIDWAADVQNEPVLLYVLEKAPHLTYTPAGLLGYCLWSPRLVEKLFSLGKTVPEARAAWSRFDEKVISQAHPDVIGMLARHGYDLNAPFVNDGFTFNHFLIQIAGRPERLVAALKAGADPSVRAMGGRSFLHVAVDGNQRSSSPLRDADEVAGVATLTVTKFRQTLQACVELAIDIDMKDESGATPLHLAARRGYANKVRALLEAGADPTLLDHKGRTPAKLAKAGKYAETQAVFAALRAHQAVLDTARDAMSKTDKSSLYNP